MRWVLVIVGILIILLGGVWVLQGTNVLTGSAVMSGHSLWTVIGAIVAVVGIVLLVLGAARRKAKQT
jgi:hypothetical protein